MQFCAKCGISNRNTAKFCCGCGEKLIPFFCPKCNKKFIFKEKLIFCDNCGTRLKFADMSEVTMEEKPIPCNGITIEFGYSQSKNLPEAINQAKNTNSFCQWGIGKNVRYRVTFQKENSRGLYNMAETVKFMKNRKVFVDGAEKEWTKVMTYCYKTYLRSEKKEKYCRENKHVMDYSIINLFGCRQFPISLDDISTIPEEFDFWLFGNLNKNGIFVFDKNKIREKFMIAYETTKNCPSFNYDFALQVLEKFPKAVNPQIDSRWSYCSEEGATIDKIVIKNGKILESFADEYEDFGEEVVGVKPKNFKAAVSIVDEIKMNVRAI